MANLTDAQKEEFLHQLINPSLVEATNFAKGNRKWDVGFKVVILILGILIVIFSAYGATEGEYAKASSVIGAILGGIVTVLSGFAFQQFDFARRQQIWETKRLALLSLRGEMILDTDAEFFRSRLNEVISWSESNPPKHLPPPQPAVAATAAPLHDVGPNK
jgi:hypothetical protein